MKERPTAVLTFRSESGALAEREFSDDLWIGSGDDVGLRLDGDAAVAPRHAVISRSSVYNVPVLLTLDDRSFSTQVNGRRVLRLKTLHHTDRIQIGRSEMTFWVMIDRVVESGSRGLGQLCLVCMAPLVLDQHAVLCPRCESPSHRDCWLAVERCPTFGCQYPIAETLCRALFPGVRSELLEGESPPVKKHKQCAAQNPKDVQSFRSGDRAIYCPDCDTPYHANCWLEQRTCKKCPRDFAALVDQLLGSRAARSAL